MLVALLRRLKPIRSLPIWARYTIAAILVLLFFLIRYYARGLETYPFLLFFPPILLASFLLDRGSGIFATLMSAALAEYFFIKPAGYFFPTTFNDAVGLVIFLLVGFLAAVQIEALRATVDELAARTDQLQEANRRLAASEFELRRSHTLMEAIIEGTPDMIFVKDREGRFILVNGATASVLSTTREAAVGRRDREFLPPAQADHVEQTDRDVIRTGQVHVIEEAIGSTLQKARTFLTTKSPWVAPDGSIIGVIGVSRDIHDRKAAEERIRVADAQKQLLLRDINHRVKNHLQTIAGLLSITRRTVDDRRAAGALDAASAQLMVLGRVYDRLHLQEHTTSVQSRPFIEGLCADLKATIGEGRAITLEVSAVDVELEPGRAVSIGLLINELLSNALKYAFPGDRQGTVSVMFSRESERMLCLEVADDGIGMEGPVQGTGTGTRLIEALTRQLAGKVTKSGPPGTRVKVLFPLEPQALVVL